VSWLRFESITSKILVKSFTAKPTGSVTICNSKFIKQDKSVFTALAFSFEIRSDLGATDALFSSESPALPHDTRESQ
jgi:hypothetical protein